MSNHLDLFEMILRSSKILSFDSRRDKSELSFTHCSHLFCNSCSISASFFQEKHPRYTVDET